MHKTAFAFVLFRFYFSYLKTGLSKLGWVFLSIPVWALSVKLTHVGFWAHVKIASRIVSYERRNQSRTCLTRLRSRSLRRTTDRVVFVLAHFGRVVVDGWWVRTTSPDAVVATSSSTSSPIAAASTSSSGRSSSDTTLHRSSDMSRGRMTSPRGPETAVPRRVASLSTS